MKTPVLVLISVAGGFLGGLFSRALPSARTPSAAISNQIRLSDPAAGQECTLTPRGIHIKWNDGREVTLDGQGFRMESGSHFVNLGADDRPPVSASYLVLDGRLWHAPSSEDKTQVLAGLAATGRFQLKSIDANQPN